MLDRLSANQFGRNRRRPIDHNVRFWGKADIRSAIGHVRFAHSDRESRLPQTVASALPPKADVCGATSDVRYGPEADMIPRLWGVLSFVGEAIHQLLGGKSGNGKATDRLQAVVDAVIDESLRS